MAADANTATEANKALMRRLVQELWNTGNVEIVDELFAPEFTSNADLPGISLPAGREGVKTMARMLLMAFPDFHVQIDTVHAAEDKVAARYIESGTHSGEFMGIAPTGKPVNFTEIAILQLANGRIIRGWYQADMLSLMAQIGAVHMPGQAAAPERSRSES